MSQVIVYHAVSGSVDDHVADLLSEKRRTRLFGFDPAGGVAALELGDELRALLGLEPRLSSSSYRPYVSLRPTSLSSAKPMRPTLCS